MKQWMKNRSQMIGLSSTGSRSGIVGMDMERAGNRETESLNGNY